MRKDNGFARIGHLGLQFGKFLALSKNQHDKMSMHRIPGRAPLTH
jgi:hypothetical protein